MSRTISNSDDVIDSRDVIKRIEELEEERRAAIEDCDHGEECNARDAHAKDFDDSEDGAELKALLSLAEEGESLADWEHGEALIRESYFEDYARELAEDIGAIGRDMQWPLSYIDWERAADALKMDYTSVDYDGVTYYGRS